MKRYYIFLINIMCALCSFAQSHSLSVANTEGMRDERVEVAVSLNNADAVTSLQCDIVLPDGIVMDGEPALTSRAHASHSLRHNKTKDGKLRIVILSSQNATFTGNNGAVFTLPLLIDEECALGNHVVSIEKIYVSTPKGVEHACANANGTLAIKQAPFTIDNKEVAVLLGSTKKLTVTFASDFTGNRNITWTTSNASVATIDNDGTIQGVGLGEAIITASAENGYVNTCKVLVKPIMAEQITLNKTALSLVATFEEQLTATVFPDNTTDKTIVWTSSDEGCATVTDDGLVKGVSWGESIITATCGNATASCLVTVTSIVYAGMINFTNIPALKYDESGWLEAVLYPSNTTYKSISWQTSDENVIKITETEQKKLLGRAYISAVGIGEATITATAIGGARRELKITVLPKITLNTSSISMLPNDTEQLIASCFPESVIDFHITWNSSDETVATVSPEGLVTAVTSGKATITATDDNGTQAKCIVTVTKPIPITNIQITSSKSPLNIGDFYNFIALITPYNTTDKNIIWATSDENILMVENVELINYVGQTVSRAKITAVGVGTATLTVTSHDGGYKAEVNVRVTGIDVSSLSFNKTKMDLLVGSTEKLTATILPENASDKTLTWSSSNEKVATVSSDGLVTGIGEGVARIEARTSNSRTASCTVTVTKPTFVTGDVNGDGKINGMDVTALINYILGKPGSSFVEAAADVNGDGRINGLDVTKLINNILNQ